MKVGGMNLVFMYVSLGWGLVLIKSHAKLGEWGVDEAFALMPCPFISTTSTFFIN